MLVPAHFSLKVALLSVVMMMATLPESTFLRRGSLSSTRIDGGTSVLLPTSAVFEPRSRARQVKLDCKAHNTE